MSRREQTSDRRDERPCQVPVDHMSLNVDQMPKLLVTLQREGGHKVKAVKREWGEIRGGRMVMLLFCWQKPGELWDLIHICLDRRIRINGVFGY